MAPTKSRLASGSGLLLSLNPRLIVRVSCKVCKAIPVLRVQADGLELTVTERRKRLERIGPFRISGCASAPGIGSGCCGAVWQPTEDCRDAA